MEETNMYSPKVLVMLLAVFFSLFAPHRHAEACTGITLRAQDGALVFARTLEWGAFDILSEILVVPRDSAFTAATPEGENGFSWRAKYGVVGINGLKKPMFAEAMNEKGLAVGLFYHPGFAEYADYDPASASISMAPTDVLQYLITTCATVKEVKAAMAKVKVVKVVEEALGFPAPLHYMISEPSGTQVVLEFKDGAPLFFEAPLGVITNSPIYDWHKINLRNYVNLSPVAVPTKHVAELDFSPLGAGSGMIGMPGDFTPPSRFVRAVAFSQTARPTKDGPETMYEAFRILDNFNVPLGAAEGSEEEGETAGMRSATIWTTVQDLKNRVIYYHTQHNRQVRKIDLKLMDFSAGTTLRMYPLDMEKQQNIKDRTPRD
jgi:choloylglycine hydrolase